MIIEIGKRWQHPMVRVVGNLGEIITEHGTRAIEWKLECGHTIVVPRYKERGKTCVKRRCKRCPLMRPAQPGKAA